MSEARALSRLPEPKAAEMLASKIEAEIRDAGWPVGDLFGSEVDLTEKYGVSRGVLREAIRILEHHFVVRTRRGRGGGLVVTEPNSSTVAQSMKLYLQFMRTNPDQIHEARTLSELAAVELAAIRITDPGRTLLSEVLAEEAEDVALGAVRQMHDFHVMVGQLSANPVLDLNVRSMAALVQEWYGEGEPADIGEDAVTAHRVHVAIAEAISAGDVDAAVRRMRRHLEALAPYVQSKAT
jgi:DNA-binding FadR family transcriptional regulator